MFQLIYLASLVHQNVNEDSPFKEWKYGDPRDGFQYPVLVGDFLYSKAFSILIETNNARHMVSLSEIVCKINKGGIIRQKNQNAGVVKPGIWREIIRLEKAELLAGCCKNGGEIAGANRQHRHYLSRFGYALGMAVGMTEIEQFEQADVYFKTAMLFLEQLVPGKGRDDLKGLVEYMMGEHVESKKLVC
jgi:geranylgeranyl pyrophosphate synthase